jgi:hypothetical protein
MYMQRKSQILYFAMKNNEDRDLLNNLDIIHKLAVKKGIEGKFNYAAKAVSGESNLINTKIDFIDIYMLTKHTWLSNFPTVKTSHSLQKRLMRSAAIKF